MKKALNLCHMYQSSANEEITLLCECQCLSGISDVIKKVLWGAWKKDKKRHDKTVGLSADVEIKRYVPYDLVILGTVSRMATQIFQDLSRKIAVFFEETNVRKRRKFMIQI